MKAATTVSNEIAAQHKVAERTGDNVLNIDVLEQERTQCTENARVPNRCFSSDQGAGPVQPNDGNDRTDHLQKTPKRIPVQMWKGEHLLLAIEDVQSCPSTDGCCTVTHAALSTGEQRRKTASHPLGEEAHERQNKQSATATESLRRTRYAAQRNRFKEKAVTLQRKERLKHPSPHRREPKRIAVLTVCESGQVLPSCSL